LLLRARVVARAKVNRFGLPEPSPLAEWQKLKERLDDMDGLKSAQAMAPGN